MKQWLFSVGKKNFTFGFIIFSKMATIGFPRGAAGILRPAVFHHYCIAHSKPLVPNTCKAIGTNTIDLSNEFDNSDVIG